MVNKLYRKKPVVIEASQWFLPGDHEAVILDKDGNYIVQTLEGPLHVSPGDWIIKGIVGEYYPCKPLVFEQTYESIEEHADSKAIFERFVALDEARDFRYVCDGYLLLGTDCYVVCDEERAKEFLSLKGLTPEESLNFLEDLYKFSFDESLKEVNISQ